MKRPNHLIGLLNDELALFLSISFGLFLFVLFFEPFPLERFDFNNRLVFVAGLSAIVFLMMVLIRVITPWLLMNDKQINHERIFSSQLGGFIILVLSSVGFAFYLRYVGQVGITFYIMIKVVLICLVPPVTLGIYDAFKELKKQNESFITEKTALQKQIEKYEEDYLNKSVEFFSENFSEKFDLPAVDVAFIKSADNYVEIVYKEGDSFKKKLIRNTLKNIEQQIKPYSNFIRCHRICIVNLHHIEKLESSDNNHWLSLRGYNEPIPVSRQYLLKLKESI
jgi:DNA-binding LytR/AlgR family response regulator